MALILAGLFGVFLCVTGAVFFVSPQVAVSAFGADPSHMADLALAPAIGGREIALGVAIAVLALLRETRALGVLLLAVALVPLADYSVAAKAFGMTAALKHLIVLPVALTFGLVLLRRSPRL